MVMARGIMVTDPEMVSALTRRRKEGTRANRERCQSLTFALRFRNNISPSLSHVFLHVLKYLIYGHSPDLQPS